MIIRTKLTIWTILTHAFIIIGLGHGIAILAVIEIMEFPYFINNDMSFSLSPNNKTHFPIIGLLSLCGQLFLLASIWHKTKTIKAILQVVGLLFLWWAVIYFAIEASGDNYFYLATSTCIPFCICTSIVFFGRPMMNLYIFLLK